MVIVRVNQMIQNVQYVIYYMSLHHLDAIVVITFLVEENQDSITVQGKKLL